VCVCDTSVIEEHLRCGVAIIPRDVLNDAAVGRQRLCTVFIDVDPQ